MAVLDHTPETKQFHNGGTFTSFGLTTSEDWKNKTTNECKEATESASTGQIPKERL